MPTNLSIKNAPDGIVERLRKRAKSNHRSLQGELLAIIEAAVAGGLQNEQPHLTIEELAAETGKLGLSRQDEAARMIREDRDTR